MNLAWPPLVRHFDGCAAQAVGTPAGREHWLTGQTEDRPQARLGQGRWLEDQRVTP